MSPNEVRSALRTQPLEPFRLVLSSGNDNEVSHPENVVVGNRFVHLYSVQQGEEFPDSFIRLDLLHVTELIPSVQPRHGGNGNGQH